MLFRGLKTWGREGVGEAGSTPVLIRCKITHQCGINILCFTKVIKLKSQTSKEHGPPFNRIKLHRFFIEMLH